MSELSQIITAKFPSCIQQINHPTHKGAPNPFHGHFFIVGTIPGDCYDATRGGSKIYPTIEAAKSALAGAGVKRFQMPDCSWCEI